MDEEEEGRKLILEDEYKKLTLLENEKNKLIEEEKLVRKKILEEVEKQERAEKKKEMRIRYLEKIKKREEDEKRLKDIKLRQEQEMKEINELKNKKKLEEEKLFLIIEGKLRLNNQEINNYRNTLNYDNHDNNDFNPENRTIYNSINNQEKNPKYFENNIENKIRTISNNDEYNMNDIIESKRNNYTIEENKQNNKIRVNKTITTSILNKNEKETEINQNNFKSFSPSLSVLSDKISTLSVKSPRNNYDTYDHSKSNMDQLISLPFSYREDKISSNILSMKNIFMTNNPANENLTLDEKNVNYYDKKKKKHMKKKRKENNINYKTNIYSDKKIFQKLIDDKDYKIRSIRENKENDFNEVNKIQEIATRAKNEIDKTINSIKNMSNNNNKNNYNTERVGIKTSSTINENPYLKYGKKYLNKKKDGIKAKNNKQNLNLNSRNFNGYLSDNYDKIRYQKSFKGDDLNILNNDENIDYNSREKNEIEYYQKENRKFNFNGVLSDNSSKFINYYQEIYGKK